LGSKGLHSDESVHGSQDKIKVIDLGEDVKLVGLRVRHEHGNPVRAISFRIAKRAPISEHLAARLDSIKEMSVNSNHLMSHDSLPDDPKVKVDYRVT
jgi:hypothetical protein